MSDAKNMKKNAAGASEITYEQRYFEIVKHSGGIHSEDLEKFFYVFPERFAKDGFNILKMLKKKMRAFGLGGLPRYKKLEMVQKKQKEKETPLTIGRISRETVRRIAAMNQYYGILKNNADFLNVFPEEPKGVSDLIGLSDCRNLAELQDNIRFVRRFAVGAPAFNEQILTLLDFVEEVYQGQDAQDNFLAMKFVLRYPEMAPLMFAADNVGKKALMLLYNAAKDLCGVESEQTFVRDYFARVYQFFGIRTLRAHIVLYRHTGSAFGLPVQEDDRKLTVKYLPGKNAFAPFFFVFRVLKVLCTELELAIVPVFLAVFFALNRILPEKNGLASFFSIFKIFKPSAFAAEVNRFWNSSTGNTAALIFLSLIFVVILVVAYCGPAFLAGYFVKALAKDAYQIEDWYGRERSFCKILGQKKGPKIRSERNADPEMKEASNDSDGASEADEVEK